MRRLLHIAILGWLVVLCVAAPGNHALACWCNRVYTSYYVDPCVSCSTAPVQCSIPQTSCYAACEQRCYLEPQVAYRVVTRLEPQTFYVRRSYYDPLVCCQRSYYVPATQFVERAYQIPVVASYVQRCTSEPSTACTTSYSQPARNGNKSDQDSSSLEPQPAERTGPNLDRPIYRERSPKSEEPPKPMPMPAPQSSRGRSVTLNSPPRPDSSGGKLSSRPGMPPPVHVTSTRRIAQSP